MHCVGPSMAGIVLLIVSYRDVFCVNSALHMVWLFSVNGGLIVACSFNCICMIGKTIFLRSTISCRRVCLESDYMGFQSLNKSYTL